MTGRGQAVVAVVPTAGEAEFLRGVLEAGEIRACCEHCEDRGTPATWKVWVPDRELAAARRRLRLIPDVQ